MSEMQLFERWFVAPLEKLKECNNGDGAFVALMMSLPLYERLLKSRIKIRDGSCPDAAFNTEVCADLGITESVRQKFWSIFRVGMMHQAMPQAGKTYWEFGSVWDGYPQIEDRMGIQVMSIDPWKFADHVIALCRSEPAALVASESFPFASIYTVPVYKVGD
jgi:hypothetical protein